MSIPRKPALLKLAMDYVAANLSVIPIKADGSKSPAIPKWKPFQGRLPNAAEMNSWFGNDDGSGVAIVCGKVSENLEVIDIDDPDLVQPWCKAVQELLPGVLERLPQICTPSGGYHVYYRCKEIEGNRKLATRSPDDPLYKDKATLIETRGEGGYVVAPGSPAACHPLAKTYRHVAGPPLAKLPTITPAERETLLDVARSFNGKTELVTGIRSSTKNGHRPGDKFNHNADWAEVLEPHGWTKPHVAGRVLYWRRPGKTVGVSATTGYCANGKSGELLYVFSSNATPFEDGRAYSKFAAYAMLNHGGDFSAAATALVKTSPPSSSVKPDAVTIEKPPLVNEIASAVLSAGVTLFASPEGDAYATVPVERSPDSNEHTATYAIMSLDFQRWLNGFCYRTRKLALQNATVNAVVNLLEAQAMYGEGEQISVFSRIGPGADGSIWLDLASEAGEFVHITENGWKIENAPAIKFVRRRGQLPLPRPERGGSFKLLRKFCNVTNADWPLLLGFMVASLRPIGPYPVLCLSGEQGSSKSTLAKIICKLLDPHNGLLRAAPKDVKSLMIMAQNSRLICLDNLSHLPQWLSDALCRLATGGAISDRALYTNADEFVIEASRPCILNGIEELATRSDLLDRSVIIELPKIKPDARRTEQEFWNEFDRDSPRILGALLDTLSTAIRRLPSVCLPTPPRLADFAKFVVAAEKAMGLQQGEFLGAYERNRTVAHELALDSSPVGPLVLQLANDGFEGTHDELRKRLLKMNGLRSTPGFPQSARALSGILKRLTAR